MSEENRKTFKHSGDLGDIIFSLPTVRAAGGGVLYLDPLGGEEEPLVNWAGGLFSRTKISKEAIDNARKLLEYQDYIDEVRYWDGEEVDYNLDKFRLHIKYNNLSDSHLAAFGFPLEERDEAWLKVPSALVNDLEKDVVFARSCRYHGNYSFWETIDRDLVKSAFFLGYEEEYEFFKYTYPHMVDLPRQTVQDLLEMARMIEGCDLFVGNQGLPHAIAEGLKKQLVNEVYRPYPSAVFQREEAKYV